MKRQFLTSLMIVVVMVAPRSWGSLNHYMEFGKDAVIDQDGNMYIFDGDIYGQNDHVFVTSKYNKEGRKLWEESYGPEAVFGFCEAITADRAKNVYVTGVMRDGKRENSSTVSVTIKYNTYGKLLWAKRYKVPKKDSFMPADIAADMKGNVYVTGRYTIDDPYLTSDANKLDVFAEYHSDFLTIKYDTNGKQLWQVRYGVPRNCENEPSHITVDNSGNVYVTGYSRIHTDMDAECDNTHFLTIKYNTNGKQLWVSRYTGESGTSNHSVVLTLDVAGNVYVTGLAYNVRKKDYADLITIKYGVNGKQQWTARYREVGLKFIFPCAIRLDKSCNVYVTASLSPMSYEPGNFAAVEDARKKKQIVTLKYDSGGKESWVTKYKGPEGYAICPRDLRIDDSDNTYVIGDIHLGALIIKYDANGNEKEVNQLKTLPELVKFLSSLQNGKD